MLKVYLAHTEDISPIAKDLGIMLTMEIKDDNGIVVENWTDYCTPGCFLLSILSIFKKYSFINLCLYSTTYL